MNVGCQCFSIELPAEMLFIDAVSWFRREHGKHLKLAEDAREDGDANFATEMEEVAGQIDALLSAGRPLRQPGLWPQIYNRALLQPWTVDGSADAMRAHALRLIEFGNSSESEPQDFLLSCRDGRGLLVVTERLRNQARYSGPYLSQVVESSRLQELIEERA